MPFAGFPPEAVEFLAKLEANNNREWFKANKKTYDTAVNEPMELLFVALDERYGGGNSKVFRIYRDVRFSKDKTPYKTWQAGHFAQGYLSLNVDGLYMGTGAYMMDAPMLTRYRAAVADDGTGTEFVKLSSALRRKGYAIEGHGDALKTVPRGYDKDHPRAELLKEKSVLVGKTFAPSEIGTPKLVDKISKVVTDVRALSDWLTAHVY